MEQKRIIVMGTVVVGIIVGIFVAVILMNRPSSNERDADKKPAIDTTARGAVPADAPDPIDAQRYRDITAIRIALNGYSGTNGQFPETLAELVPTYLNAVPSDPVTGKPYPYVVKDRAYTLSFRLDHGAISLAAGDHFLTPRGFDVPAVEIAPREVTETASMTIPPEPGSEAAADDALAPDTDGDGLTDADELASRTDPDKADTDRDGLADGDEANVFDTDPLNADTDGDSFSDGQELGNGFDPSSADVLSAERKAAINAAATDYGIHPPTNIALPLQ